MTERSPHHSDSAGGKNVTMAQRHYIGKSQKYLRQVVDEGFGRAVLGGK